MSALRSAVDEILDVDVAALSDAEIDGELAELERTSRTIEAARAARVAEVDRRRSYAADGFLSTTAWLRHRFGLSASAAAEQVRIARALERMPTVRGALAEGRISGVAAAVLASAREADPVQFASSEESLVELASTLPLRDLARAVEHWRLLADAGSREEAAERRFARRGLYVSSTLDGMIRLDGDLDPETGQTVITAIRSIVDPTSRSPEPDDRTPAQRRADALGEICRRHLDASERPTVAGERPHLVVTLDVAELERCVNGRGRLDDVGTIPPSAVRRLACDAGITRVITGPRSEPLEVGRRTAVVPAPLRRAVVVRDGRCRFPGCDRPPPWCDAHHVVHWADGGETSLTNLVLLCRRHHRMVHERFGLELVDGSPVFRRPNGTVLEDRAPP